MFRNKTRHEVRKAANLLISCNLLQVANRNEPKEAELCGIVGALYQEDRIRNRKISSALQ